MCPKKDYVGKKAGVKKIRESNQAESYQRKKKRDIMHHVPTLKEKRGRRGFDIKKSDEHRVNQKSRERNSW